jgi:hypothetical protein
MNENSAFLLTYTSFIYMLCCVSYLRISYVHMDLHHQCSVLLIGCVKLVSYFSLLIYETHLTLF